jgi:STIP1 homology and U-box containing protein 1
MAGSGGVSERDKVEAVKFKEQGNKRFGNGDYSGATEFYSKAIHHDPTNPLFYTNRAMACLKTAPPNYRQAAADSRISIELLPKNLKAFFYLAQAQIELKMEEEALKSALEAHRLCVEECMMVPMGKGSSNIGKITELVLRCKKERWEEKERERKRMRGDLLAEIVAGFEAKKQGTINGSDGTNSGAQWDKKIEELQQTFEHAEEHRGEEAKRRDVPDWCIDAITFSVMVDPVVVCCPFSLQA